MRQISRRSFLKGSAIGAAAVSAMTMMGVPAMADDEEKTTWSGTRYTKCENPYGISYPRSEAEIGHVEEADAVVVGSGIGGMMAAMIMKEQMPEANIVLIEKNAFLGGSTNHAECNGPNQALTEKAALSRGISHASGLSYMADPMLMKNLCMDQGMNSAWLFEKHGVQYSKGGMSFYVDGNGDGFGEGSSAIKTLEAENESVGVDIRVENRAIALVVSEDGYTVSGIQVLDNESDEIYQINCKAVVLATGGMANAMQPGGLCSYYTSQDVEKCYGWGSGQEGDGHLMVEQTAHGMAKTLCLVGQFINVRDFAYTSQLGVCVSMQASNFWVNQEGIRFANEATGVGKMVELEGSVLSIVGPKQIEFWENGGCNKKISGFADILVGANFKDPAGIKAPFPSAITGEDVYYHPDLYGEIEKYKDNPEVFMGDTKEALAAAIAERIPNFDAEAFLATWAAYDAACESGVDEMFEKDAQYLVSPGPEGPYYAFRLTSGVLNTCSGIRINTNAQVVDPRYNVINGLFAAGINTSGWDGEVYGGGTCQPVAMFCGSKAARYIVENILGGTVAEDWYGDDPEGYTVPTDSVSSGGPGGPGDAPAGEGTPAGEGGPA
ncbi:MAG: FAD-binding protein [Lachnospiraceae bacterium]|nr:FAD-binding protein [Lachnospiraceae bacterium]